MLAFVIGLSIAFSIFFVTSIAVIIRRKQKAARNVGYLISEGAPVNAPNGVPVYQCPPSGGVPAYQCPPPGYQTNVYPGTYAYPVNSISHVQVQTPIQMSGFQAPMTGMNASYPPMQQRDFNQTGANANDAELSVLPSNSEKPVTHQSHQGAVESVSQI